LYWISLDKKKKKGIRGKREKSNTTDKMKKKKKGKQKVKKSGGKVETRNGTLFNYTTIRNGGGKKNQSIPLKEREK